MISRIKIIEHKGEDAGLYPGKDYMTEKEIRNLMEEIIRETNISELCSKEGIDANTYYNWSKDFIRIIRGKLLNGDEPVTVDSVTQNLKNENRHFIVLEYYAILILIYLKVISMAIYNN